MFDVCSDPCDVLHGSDVILTNLDRDLCQAVPRDVQHTQIHKRFDVRGNLRNPCFTDVPFLQISHILNIFG